MPLMVMVVMSPGFFALPPLYRDYRLLTVNMLLFSPSFDFFKTTSAPFSITVNSGVESLH